jgi:predicted nucleic acid-binding Zn ribbon protein
MLPPPKRLPPRGPLKRTAQQRVLAQWRGTDLTPLEIAQASRARKVGDLVPQVLTGFRVEQRRGEVEIVKVWNNLIDPTITAHAQPVGLNKGTLFVNVDNNVWLSEIVRYRRKEILDRLQHSFGREVITRISYRIG